MPTYDYACRACGHEFELFQSITAPVKKKCPECGELRLERKVGTGAGILFKGSGFYETDYRSEGYRKAAEAEKKSSEGTGEKTSKKDGESKPAAKGESAGKSTGKGSGDGNTKNKKKAG